ncbi:MAG: hypothetical protein H6642_00515 [Caldilineaceae bacterium]|nr:hypothetical protein [Caldilineaceae bacterium]MCB9136808.1 hypothetical protein [Caldilineaceae bacterium]
MERISWLSGECGDLLRQMDDESSSPSAYLQGQVFAKRGNAHGYSFLVNPQPILYDEAT